MHPQLFRTARQVEQFIRLFFDRLNLAVQMHQCILEREKLFAVFFQELAPRFKGKTSIALR